MKREKKCIICGKVTESKATVNIICPECLIATDTCPICGNVKSILNSGCCAQHSKEATCLKLYGMKNAGWHPDSQKKIKDTCQERWGSDSPGGAPEVRDKINTTLISQYGANTPFASEEIQNKSRVTIKELYGVDNVSKLPEIKKKVTDTNIRKYGVKTTLQTPEQIQRTKEFMLNKYGVDHYSKTVEFKEKFKNTCLKKYGSEHHMQNPEFLKTYMVDHPNLVNNNHGAISKLNKYYSEIINERTGLDVIYEFQLEDKYYDLKIDKLLIEINPTISHNSDFSYAYLTSRDVDNIVTITNKYHFEKWKLANKYGYELISVFDWMDTGKTINFIVSKLSCQRKIFARKAVIKDVDKKTAGGFLNANHILGDEKTASIIYGLYSGDELLSVMSFGKPRFSKKADYELLRYCSLPETMIVGGSKKLFNHFIKTILPNSIVTYSSNSFGNGTVYERLGFVQSNQIKPAKNYMTINTNHCVKHTSLVKQGADRLLKNIIPNYFKVGLDRDDFIKRGGKQEYSAIYDNLPEDTDWWPGNVDILKHYHYLTIYDCGTTEWLYTQERG